uniref:G protein-coupled receptor n=1 Tax=Globodera pallida TaxID=36090 RepID=A0A183BKW6_GLOPA
MELLLFRPKDFAKLYGCDGFNASQVPLSNRTNVVNGSLLILLFVLFEILYIPCMMSIYKNIDTACYKLLFFIGILDMLVIFMNGLETGILGIIGAVFCDYPILIYTSGSVGLALWYAETGVELLLAINRCMELLRPSMAHAIFSEPILFSGIYFSWFFNPYVGYVDDFGQIYHSTPHTVHDYFVIFGLSAIYLAFSAMLTFLQVVIISFFNAVCSGIYILMQFIRISEIYIIIGTYTWLFAHGCPPIVYLLLNVRIRKDFANFVRAILRRPCRGHAVVYALNTTAWVNSGTNANEKLMDPNNGWYDKTNDTAILEAEVTADKPDGVE